MLKHYILKLLLVLLSTFYSITSSAQCADANTDPSPGSFVQDQWTAYVYQFNTYNGTNFDYSNYRGYYIDAGYGINNLNIDSDIYWGTNNSPSNTSNTNYEGCSVTDNNHLVSYKRKGFPSGNYIINLAGQNGESGHDDSAKLIIDGTEVWSHNGCCDTHYGVWSGSLDNTTEIEFVWSENAGNSYGRLQIVEDTTVPDPETFGNNEWVVAVFDGNSFQEYAGTYTHTGLDFNTSTLWGTSSNPSNAPGYVGTSVQNENHSYIYRREGFPCGYYQLDIPRHDDDVVLTIDGVDVYQLNDWDSNVATPNVWQGFLGTNSQIEFSIREFSGASIGALAFNYLFGPDNDPNEFVWTGSVDTNPALSGNWCSGLPSANGISDILVPANVPNYPSLPLTASIHELTIKEGAQVDLTSNNTLSLTGDLNNYGSIPAGATNLEFAGATQQNINGNSFETENLTIDQGSDLVINLATDEMLRINATLSVENGTLETNDQLTLACRFDDLTQRVAQIGDLSNGSITGEIITEQCIPGTRAFRFLTSTVTSTNTIREDWQEDPLNYTHNPKPGYGTHITGVNGAADGTNGFDYTPSGNPSMYIFNNITSKWEKMPNTDNTSLIAGVPYRLMVRGNRSTDITSNLSLPSNTILRAQGSIASGTITMNNFNNVSGSANFFGNPYPAAIDMNLVLKNNINTTNFQSDYYIWDPTIGGTNGRGAYVTIDMDDNSATAGSDANQFLQPGQAAFLLTGSANTTPQLNIEESFKNVNANQTTVFRPKAALPSMELTLFPTQAYINQETASDGLKIKFDSNYQNSASTEDAPKFFNLDETFASKAGSDYLAINRRDFPLDQETIPLYLAGHVFTQYTLKIQTNQLSSYDIYLVDHYLLSETKITSSTFIHQFNVDMEIDESINSERFELKFVTNNLTSQQLELKKLQVYPNPITEGLINIEIPTNFSSDLEFIIYNIAGQAVYANQKIIDSNRKVRLSNLQLSTGIYILEVIDSKSEKKLSQKLIIQ